MPSNNINTRGLLAWGQIGKKNSENYKGNLEDNVFIAFRLATLEIQRTFFLAKSRNTQRQQLSKIHLKCCHLYSQIVLCPFKDIFVEANAD